MRVHRRLLATMAVAAGVVAVALAAPVMAEAPEETPPNTVEDTSYPGAAQILAERDLKVIAGDGNIVLTDCGPPGLIEVRSTEKGRICFKAQPAYWGGRYPTTAFITVEIPSVYTIKGDEKDVEATLTVNNQSKVYPIEKNAWTPVGEGAGPGNPPETLLEIRAEAP